MFMLSCGREQCVQAPPFAVGLLSTAPSRPIANSFCVQSVNATRSDNRVISANADMQIANAKRGDDHLRWVFCERCSAVFIFLGTATQASRTMRDRLQPWAYTSLTFSAQCSGGNV